MSRRAAVLAVALAALAAPAGAAAQADPLAALKSGCEQRRSTDRAPVAYRICTGVVRSYDGTPLDVTLTLPAARTRRRLPLLVFLHGFLSAKAEYLSRTRDGTGPNPGTSPYKVIEFNNVWYASRGYAVLNYSSRGHGGSGGSIQLASKHVELRDTRWLTGLLVDGLGPLQPVDGLRLGVLGGSYGGGQTWLLLATRGPGAGQYGSWRSPAGREVRIAAAVPQFTWSNFLTTLLPNGRALISGPTDPRATERPIGIGKLTVTDGLFAASLTKLPAEVRAWVVRLNLGEPYDPDREPLLRNAVRGLTEDRSALYQHDFFRALPSRRQRAVPVLAAQGWTDPIFPAAEAVRMYRRLRAARRNYPIQLYFGDFEHLTAQIKLADMRYYHRLATALLDRYLRGRGRRPRFDVRSARTRCDPGFGPIARASRFGLLGPERLTLELDGPKLTLSPLLDLRGIAADPLAASLLKGRACTVTRTPPPLGAATWSVPLTRPYTLAGLPRLRLRYRALGPHLQLDARLWDRAPDGRETLVTRGAYRADPRAREAVTELFGNHWRFERGHSIVLEVLQADAPYLRPSTFPATATIDSAELALPGKGG